MKSWKLIIVNISTSLRIASVFVHPQVWPWDFGGALYGEILNDFDQQNDTFWGASSKQNKISSGNRQRPHSMVSSYFWGSINASLRLHLSCTVSLSFLKWSYDTVDGCEIPHQLVGGCLSRYSRYNPTKFTNLQCFIATNRSQLLRDATIHSIPAAEVYPSCSSLDPAEMQRISSLSRQKKKTSLENPWNPSFHFKKKNLKPLW